MSMIKELPGSERPREKALQFGVSALSTRELMALILRTGSKGESVLQVADELLRHSNGISGLEQMSRQDLCEVRGISNAKAIELLACFELNKRVLYEKAQQEVIIGEPEHMIQWLQKEIGSCVQEKFMVVYLDNSHHIISCHVLFIGTVNMSHVYPRDVLRDALKESAVSMIIVHNHPSGTLEPSEADIRITTLMIKTANMMGIKIDDHLIITKNAWFSFARAGIIEQILEQIDNQ